jgi:hypothetical protein
MGDPLFRLLSVSSNRNANLVMKDGVMNAYGAKALYCGPLERDDSSGDAAMHINLSPSDGIAPILSKRIGRIWPRGSSRNRSRIALETSREWPLPSSITLAYLQRFDD